DAGGKCFSSWRKGEDAEMERTTVGYDKLRHYMQRMFVVGLKYPEESAEITARVLVEADARGHASHGVARVSMYAAEVWDGKNVPQAKPEIVHETPVSLVIQGNRAPGFPVSRTAMERTLEKAEENGTCMTVVRDSCHFGMAGYWAEQAADRGMIGWAFTNTLGAAIPLFGRERLLGTNPISVAIPTGRKPHFMLDMATTTVAFGKIEVAARRGGTMPTGWAVDGTGTDTTDAVTVADTGRGNKSPYGGLLFLGGATETLGGHKGYGLGLLVELLTSGLSMGTASFDTYGDGCGICHCFQAMRMDLFGDAGAVQRHVAGILDRIRSSPRAEGQERIYIHGEKEFERREKALKEGIWLDPATWRRLDEYADKFGVERLEP
ncbi:Ldh family oxidoreductase, partial [uncultured Fretibacterium sp.]|uniref:Ldh family oxidoreductase n=1 Tax=uncultured Fretibacterium sp. TaxID=1678694 RepID=UPI003454E5D5